MNKKLFFTCLISLPVILFVTWTLDSKVTDNKVESTIVLSPASANAKSLQAEGGSTKSVDLWSALGIEKIGPATPPIFKIENMSGEMTGLDAYKGNIVFLNFWATWCPPCVLEMPAMDSLYKTFKDQGLVVVAINDYEPRARVEKFLKTKDYSFPILIDPSGKVSEDFRAIALPYTFIINKEGFVIGKVIGMRDWSSPESVEFFKELLKD